MQFFILAMIIGVITFSLFRMVRKNNSTPSNKYTPIDDIDNGLVRDNSRDPPTVESRNDISYEEVDK